MAKATRDQHRFGTHPHISVQDTVFVECVGGDLTIKIEDNTEQVLASTASLSTMPIRRSTMPRSITACLGTWSFSRFVPTKRKSSVTSSIASNDDRPCDWIPLVLLAFSYPTIMGSSFPTGFFLQTGAYKLFDHGLRNTIYQKTIAAPNGEDFLYQFFEPVSGSYLHLRYNLIRQEVDTPLICHGQSYFDDGRMITMRAQDHPQKHHALQIWQTPFVGPNYQAPVTKDSMLYKIGTGTLFERWRNAKRRSNWSTKMSPTRTFMSISPNAQTIFSIAIFGSIGRNFSARHSDPKIRDTAEAAIDEYEKVVRVRSETSARFGEAQKQTNLSFDRLNEGVSSRSRNSSPSWLNCGNSEGLPLD